MLFIKWLDLRVIAKHKENKVSWENPDKMKPFSLKLQMLNNHKNHAKCDMKTCSTKKKDLKHKQANINVWNPWEKIWSEIVIDPTPQEQSQ